MSEGGRLIKLSAVIYQLLEQLKLPYITKPYSEICYLGKRSRKVLLL